MGEFLDLPPEYTFVHIVREFIASLHYERTSSDDEFPEYNIQFQLYNKSHKISLTRLNEIFHCDPRNSIFNLGEIEGFNPIAVWRTMSGAGAHFVSRECYASELQHPAIRIFHRLICFLVYSKADLSKINAKELKMLYLAAYPSEDPTARINTGWFFIERCCELRQERHRTGTIQLGGLVTVIARALGHDRYFTRSERAGSHYLLDDEYLTNSCFIRVLEQERRYSWMVGGTHHSYLPSRNASDITWNRPWLISPEPLSEEDSRIIVETFPSHAVRTERASRREHVRGRRDAVPERPPTGPTFEQGEASSSSQFDLSHAFA